ncbi:MAG TPA: hypothetical protein VFE33_03920 [Thermoanaerobaculia bacterium]|nr:hypothetical protein [Thermoanaerobaculia bacterium]
MDQELIAYLEQRFVAMERKMDERFDQVNESIHRNRILLEETRHEVQIVAEGVIGGVEQVQSLRADVERRLIEFQGMIVQHRRDNDIRLSLLEERSGRQGQAALEYIKERYGRKTT